jgi:hypothetical protein
LEIEFNEIVNVLIMISIWFVFVIHTGSLKSTGAAHLDLALCCGIMSVSKRKNKHEGCINNPYNGYT